MTDAGRFEVTIDTVTGDWTIGLPADCDGSDLAVLRPMVDAIENMILRDDDRPNLAAS